MYIKLSDYEVICELHSGLRSKIYKGKRILDGYPVIIKVVNKEYQSNEDMKLLQKEFEIGKKIKSSNVIKYLDIVKVKCGYAIVEEYFNSETIQELNKSYVFKPKEFLSIAIRICNGLKKIHAKNIIHGSINPSNILYEQKNGEVKIIDFSNAKYLSNENYILKKNNTLKESLNYISPEQTGRINRTIDYRSDFYSLGITFYEMLTGRLPFEFKDTMEIIYNHVAKEPKNIEDFNLDIPKAVSKIILKLIAKNPEERYKSVSGLKRDLEKCLIQMENNSNEDFELGKYDFSENFFLPQKLYGRCNEIQTLINSFHRISTGSSELVLVSGSSGIGKSTLVKEVFNSVYEENGYFIIGKFEQLQNDNIPYSAILKALDNFINQLLLESSRKLEVWKENILQAVGNNGQVIIDVLPNLELIIGKQQPVPQLGVVETQNRFNIVFENLIQSIASKEHPLVIFIDDLHWADYASLNFIRMITTNESIKNLLVIGAYRDNDINSIYSSMSLINELIENNIVTKVINLKELQENDLQLMLEETLVSFEPDFISLKELAGFIHNKTLGNPFFVIQFLKDIYDYGYIWFDYKCMKWCFNIEEIEKLNLTENVIEFLDNKIKTLEQKTIENLKYGACIGNEFDLNTLTLVSGELCEIILDSLKQAFEIGLIYINKDENLKQAQETIIYNFVHDHIQQIVYSMISEEERCAIHLKLGHIYLKKCTDLNNSEQVFKIVRQLNAGSAIITDESEKIELSELNLKAGIIAKKSSAYSSAYVYFKYGIKLLSDNGWKEYYDLTLQLYLNIAAVANLTNRYKEVDKYIDSVFSNGKTLLDKIEAYKIRIEVCKAQLSLKEAMNISLSVLKTLGIYIPSEPKKIELEEAFEVTWNVISRIEIDKLINMPSMKDPMKLAAMQILLISSPVAYQLDSMLGQIVTFKMAELTAKYGNCTFAPVVYSFYSAALCSLIDNIELGNKLDEYIEFGYKLGRVSIKLAENSSMKQYKSVVLDVDTVFVKHWKEHLREELEPFMEGYWSGIENGNFEYAGYCVAMYSKNLFYSGQTLEAVGKEIDFNVKRLQKIRQGLSIIWTNIFRQTVQNLQGKCNNVLEFKGDYFNEEKMLPIMSQIGDVSGIRTFYLNKLIVNCHLQNYSVATECAKELSKDVEGFAASIDIAIFYFYDSLLRLAINATLTKEEQKENLLRVSMNQVRMKTWSKFAPMNFLNKYYLIEAELCKVTGDHNQAIKYYDKAIDLANENEYLNEEALTYELAGKFYFDKNKMDTAKAYLREARNKYELWGATVKVDDLLNKYPDILLKNNDIISDSNDIDLFSIMKACQAISSEINLEELLRRLMIVILENMGAQRGFLILKEEENFVIEAYIDRTSKKKEILISKSLEEWEELPKTVIRFTGRTGENVVFSKKTDKFLFSRDPYIINKKPKSFISTAIKLKNEIKGVVYLENNLVEDAFKTDRVQVIEILSTQAAISLENAMLYNTLEQNMKDKLRDSEVKLNITANSAGLGFWDLDVKNTNLIFNEEWATMLGYTSDELTPINLESYIKKFIHPDDINKMNKSIERCFSKELDKYECEIRFKHKNGDWVWMLDRGKVTEWDENNKPSRMCGIQMNISERKIVENELELSKKAVEEAKVLKTQFLNNTIKDVSGLNTVSNVLSNLQIITEETSKIKTANLILEEVNTALEAEIERYSKTEAELVKAKREADKANIAKSNFIANLSHELRTPIAVILSGIQLIEVNIKNDEIGKKQNLSNHINTIKQNCYRLLRLVNNIIDVTKIDAGFKNVYFQKFDIISLVENITTSVVEYAKLKGITVIFDTDEEERIIAIDPDKIERIILNLLSNAIKFTPKNGHIFVKILSDATKVIISIEDTGIGIPVEKKELIFEKFQQIDNTFTRSNEGSGIGLSLVKSFVELHKGKISVFSELGKGSKFVIELPTSKLGEDLSPKEQVQAEIYNSSADILNIEFSDIYFD
jgi:PAS domain S-box